MDAPTWISESLRVIVGYELARGNAVERVDEPAGSRCPLAVIFTKPLDFQGFKKCYAMPPGVVTWENLDPHYPLEAGYLCERTRHAIGGPIQ